MRRSEQSPAILRFGRCQLLVQSGELTVDGVPVQLGRRAVEVLLVLIEARGQLVSKDEILSRAWPGRVVEENTLQVHMSALRKALGEDARFLQTLSGRGYRFIADIGEEDVEADPGEDEAAEFAESLAGMPNPTNLLEPVSDLIGRDAEIADIGDLTRMHRLITLVGAGGIGKTRLALEVARRRLPDFADGVWLAELGTLSDPELVPNAVAAALGLTLSSGTLSPARVTAALGTRQVLLILDNCEHVIQAAAQMAEALLRANPLARVLTTSREPLRLPGEAVYRVPSLDVPAEATADDADLMASGALKLFIARARAAEPDFSPDHAVAATIATICRRLDGIPLAIELAAARVASLGVRELADRLDDRFQLLTGGYRTALPRQQTLRAALDWSYELLPDSERLVLQRLAIFAGAFPLEAAAAVLARTPASAPHVIDCITNLVAKSLLTMTSSGAGARYRLLETTRVYAHEKLSANGEVDEFARRHAEYYLNRLLVTGADWEERPTAESLNAQRRRLDNVRAALDWAFSARGDESLGIALTIASVPLWFQLSLLGECRGRVEHALAGLRPESGIDADIEMQLNAAFGLSLFYTRGAAPETDAAWTKTFEMAQTLNSKDYQLQALWGLWVCRLTSGEFRSGQSLAQRFCALAEVDADPDDMLVGDRMLAHILHYFGDQSAARLRLERSLHRKAGPAPRSRTIRFLLDLSSSARTILAQSLWLQGYPDQALRCAQLSVEEARNTGHAISACYALALAQCPISLSIGNLEVLEKSVAMALDHSARHSLPYWHAWVRCFEGMLITRHGDANRGLLVFRTALDDLRETGFGRGLTLLLGHYAEILAEDGQIAPALAAIDEAFERAERDGEQLWMADLFRIKGDVLVREKGMDAEAASERYFVQGLDLAREQGALSLELRCATSLASLRHKRGLNGQARDVLAPVYARFTEGFETADLKAANALLARLSAN